MRNRGRSLLVGLWACLAAGIYVSGCGGERASLWEDDRAGARRLEKIKVKPGTLTAAQLGVSYPQKAWDEIRGREPAERKLLTPAEIFDWPLLAKISAAERAAFEAKEKKEAKERAKAAKEEAKKKKLEEQQRRIEEKKRLKEEKTRKRAEEAAEEK